MTDDRPPPPRPGWYVQLEGNEGDLGDWCHSLNDPFDPVTELLPDGKTALRSADFEGLEDASEVRERALVLIARLNGAIGLWNGADPVRFGGVLRIDEAGNQRAWIFAELHANAGRARVRGTATVIVTGPDGQPLPPPPPEPSMPQRWNELAELNDDTSDLLDQYGRADNWYDIYKTIEIAAHLVGSKHRLWRLAGAEAAKLKNLDRTANFFRHARGAPRPSSPVTLNEARPLLSWLVQRVLEGALARSQSAS